MNPTGTKIYFIVNESNRLLSPLTFLQIPRFTQQPSSWDTPTIKSKKESKNIEKSIAAMVTIIASILDYVIRFGLIYYIAQ